MQNQPKQITQKQRKAKLISDTLFAIVVCTYLGMRLGYFQMAVAEDHSVATAFFLLLEGFMDKPWQIWPTNIMCIGIGLFIAAILWVLIYNQYVIYKDTVDYVHGTAAFEEDFNQYEKEFVCDPSVIEEVTHVKMTDKNCPRNEENKKVFNGIKNTQSRREKYRNAIEECRRRSIILTDRVYLSLNGDWSQRNSNVCIIGAAGSGKSRYVLKPNVLQNNSSLIITDPSGDIMAATGYFLKEVAGYDVRCLNIANMDQSLRFNPLYYINSVKDIAIIVDTFLANIKSGNTSGGDDAFWTSTNKNLMCAIVGYLYEVCPLEQRNFSNVLNILKMDGRTENDDADMKTDFDRLFENLGEANPASYSYQQYLIFKMAPAKTRLSILINTSVYLSQLDIPEVKNLTYKDELDLDKVGEKKMAIFLIIPQAQTTYTW